jgi:hypothetical protein
MTMQQILISSNTFSILLNLQYPEKQFGAEYPCRPHFFFAQIEGYIYVDYLFKCCTQLKYAENSTTGASLRVLRNSRQKTKSSIPTLGKIEFVRVKDRRANQRHTNYVRPCSQM